MGSVLNYYEIFLGQTELLNVVPIKELAATFSNLKVRQGDWISIQPPQGDIPHWVGCRSLIVILPSPGRVPFSCGICL